MFTKRRKFKKKAIEALDVDEVFLDSFQLSKQEFRWEHRLETLITSRPMHFIWMGVFILFIFFGAKLFYLAIIQGNQFKAVAEQNYIKEIWQRSPRGIIYSSNLKPLVQNTSTFNLVAIPAELPKEKENQEHIIFFLQEVFKKDRGEVIGLFEDINRFSFRPIPLFVDVSRDQLLAFQSLKDELPGLRLEENFKREYVNSTYYSHLLGYTGLVSRNDLEERTDYLLTDLIGKSGIELIYEEDLRGEYGKDEIEINSRGEEGIMISSNSAEAGRSLVLFIDDELQEYLTDVMKKTLSSMGLKKASAVAIDPRSGGILAMQSFPLYDNNIFSSPISQEDYELLFESKNKPLFNRAISGLYSPGSTIKPFIGAAALTENIITKNTTVNVTGNIEVAGQEFKDWKLHGIVNLKKAIAVSSNVFFYTIGGGHGGIDGLGPYLIEVYLSKFGLDSLNGIDLPGEQAGLLPNPDWKKDVRGEKWFIGDTYNISIGQGDMLVTPLGLTSAVGAIANGGTLLKPRLVKEITSQNLDERKSNIPEILRKNIIPSDYLEQIREGMREAVRTGSARQLNYLPVSSAGKTGTAQVRKDQPPNSWFVSFAPYDNPEIVLVVLVENGGEGTAAAVPIARDVLNWYFTR